MSRIDVKRLLILMLTAALAFLSVGAWAEEDILQVDQLAPEQVNYRTATVETGIFEKTVNVSASEYYPLTYNVRFEGSDAKFVEYTINRGAEVKKGDVLAKFEITGSEVQITSMELNLKRLQEDTERGIREREEAISEARAAVAEAKDPGEKELRQLELRKKEIELEQYRYRQEYSIESQQNALQEELERREQNVLLAPIDGVVTDLRLKKVDDAVLTGESLVTISSQDVLLLRVDNSQYGMRYNMPVVVVSGNNSQRVELTGRVVAADDCIPEKKRTGYAFIQLDPYDPEIKLRTLKVTAPTIRLENVVMAKRNTVTIENGKYYVSKLENGMVQKRYVTIGMLNTTDAWYLSGVDVGETLVID